MTTASFGGLLETIFSSDAALPAFIALWKSIPPAKRPGDEITSTIIDGLIASHEELVQLRKAMGTVVVHWPDGTTITVPVGPGQRIELRAKEQEHG